MGQLSSAGRRGVEHSPWSRAGALEVLRRVQSPSLFVWPLNGRLTEVAGTPLYERFAGAVRLSRVYEAGSVVADVR